MSWEAFLALYIAGAVVCVFITTAAMRRETTAHGQDIILGMGCLLVILWPLALAWAAIVGVGAAIVWAFNKVRGT